MKTGIITIHYGINYGSALQSYALSRYMSKFENNEVTVINYIPIRYTRTQRYLQTKKDISGIKKILYLLAVAPNTFRYQLIFDRFLKKYLPLGKKIYTVNDLEKKYRKYDLLISGSDQVWNTDYNGGVDLAYYLAFASKNSQKISYAASCGKDSFSREELDICKKFWSKFDYLSLREDVTTKMLNDMGYEKAIQVLDPIFLLTEDEWREVLPRDKIKEPYVLIYALDGDTKKAIEIAIQIAKEKKMKIVMVSYGHIWSHDSNCDYYLKARSPLQFLSLLANSDFVITNSFHGIAFSLRFRKQFVPVPRDKYNNRIDSILRLTGLESKLCIDPHNLRIEDINYVNDVDKKIYDMENRSKDYLAKVIADGDKNER